ncbi:unnamed protein product [marine sediment metagenome]|uniref:Uncharacterized protein n=1 Tax=marine sediment metagenome TaxID=412755 RepID=X1GYC6_9ZZZZ
MGWLRPYAAKAKVEHEFDVDHLNIWVTFRFAMETTSDPLAEEVVHDVKPPNAKWLVEADSVEKPVSASAWQDTWTMLLTVPDIAVYPNRVTLEYNGPDENLRITWDKQWEPWGPILSADIGKAPGFVDRGDPAVYDYAKEDLTIDGAWHDLDLSHIVPEKAKAVFMLGHLQGNDIDWHIMFRKKGNVNEVVHGGMETIRANIERHRSSIVALDANRKIQYKVDDENWDTLDLAVKGWWF